MKTSKTVRELYPIYDGDDDTYRFKLGTVGKKTLIVIGLNPSTATDEEPDLTIKKIMKFAENDYDSFIMLNLYAQRTTHPKYLHEKKEDSLHKENLKHIIEIISSKTNVSFLAAWGNNIESREYLFSCLEDIQKAVGNADAKWYKIGEKPTKKGHPKHPSRPSYKNELTDFDIESYLKDKNQPII